MLGQVKIKLVQLKTEKICQLSTFDSHIYFFPQGSKSVLKLIKRLKKKTQNKGFLSVPESLSFYFLTFTVNHK